MPRDSEPGRGRARRFDVTSARTVAGDLLAGVTTAAVALPVALGFGIAAGVGPLSGLYGAVAVGFFAAVFGGAPAQVSGTAAPVAIAMAIVVTRHAHDLAEAFTIVVLAGLIQLLFGFLRLGRFIAYTPYSVVSGFMSGIGVVIIVMQAPPILGGASAPGGALASLRAWPDAMHALNPDALMIAALSLAVCFGWPTRIRRFVPAPLAAVALGTLAGSLWFTDAPVLGPTVSGLPAFRTPTISPEFFAGALQPAFVLALIGSVNSLLTLLVADSLTGRRHDPNRELVGQGLGNIAAGVTGGLPGAGSPPFTVLNISAGGRTALAGVVRAAILLALALGLGRVAEPVPQAALAGILVKVGWDTVDWRFLARLPRIEPGYRAVMLTTLVLTVFSDLMTAVALGFIAAGIVRAQDTEQAELDGVLSTPLLDRTFLSAREQTSGTDPFAAHTGLLALRGRFTVASAHALALAVGADIRQHEVVIFDFSQTSYMDDSAALVMERLVDIAFEQRTACIVMGLSPPVADTLHSLGVLRRVPKHCFVDDLNEARRVAKRILDERDQGGVS